VHGLAGTAGAVGGVLFNTVVGWFARHNHHLGVFVLLAALQPLGVTALWLWLRDRSDMSAQA